MSAPAGRFDFELLPFGFLLARPTRAVVFVTRNLQQAARVSDCIGFMLLAVLKEFGTTKQVFANPKQKETEDYISGRFG